MGYTKAPYPWHPDADGILTGVDDCGDYQVTDAASVRLVNDANRSFIQVNAYGGRANPDAEDGAEPEYAVIVQLEWEELDGAGEEDGADITYNTALDPASYSEGDLASGALDRAVLAAARHYLDKAASLFCWDGTDLDASNPGRRLAGASFTVTRTITGTCQMSDGRTEAATTARIFRNGDYITSARLNACTMGRVYGMDATDEQIVRAVLGDEDIFTGSPSFPAYHEEVTRLAGPEATEGPGT